LKSSSKNLNNIIFGIVYALVNSCVVAVIFIAFWGTLEVQPMKLKEKAQETNIIIRGGITVDERQEIKGNKHPNMIIAPEMDEHSAYWAFANGAVDMVCTNAFLARLLVDKEGGEALAYEAYKGVDEPVRQRHVLVMRKPGAKSLIQKIKLAAENNYVQETRGLSLLLGEETRRQAEAYFKLKDIAVKSWFGDLRYEESDLIALKRLDSGYVDLVAVAQKNYKEYLVLQRGKDMYHQIIASYENILLVKKRASHSTSASKIKFLNDTRGLRLLLSGSKNTRRFVEQFLTLKTGSIKNWFTEVRYGETDAVALEELLQEKVDVISLKESTYKKFLEKHSDLAVNYEMVWFSADIPRSVIVARSGVKIKAIHYDSLLAYVGKEHQWFSFNESSEKFENWQFRIAGKKFDYLNYFSEESK